MKNRLLSIFAAMCARLCWLPAAAVTASPLSNFPALTATEGDAPLTLTPPTSKSPAVFSYSSSNPQVATVNGNVLTFIKAGTSTITARQPELGSYNPTSIDALLTVKEKVCTAPQVNQGGTCVTPPTCTAPAVLTNNVCVAPATTGNFVGRNGLSFMPVTRIDTWTNASAFCSTSTINNLTGWRLPIQARADRSGGVGRAGRPGLDPGRHLDQRRFGRQCAQHGQSEQWRHRRQRNGWQRRLRQLRALSARLSAMVSSMLRAAVCDTGNS